MIFDYIAFNFHLPHPDREKWLIDYIKQKGSADEIVLQIRLNTSIEITIDPYVARALQELREIRNRRGLDTNLIRDFDIKVRGK